MREYDPVTLRRVQLLELMILRDFSDLCRRHGLSWFGIAGTGIGAVRHRGFIPWDDDIDIGLLRADHDNFVRYAREELGDKYLVLTADAYSDYPLMTTRLILRDTKFREEAMKNISCPFGIFLDIYPFDRMSDDPRAFRKQCRGAWFFSKLLILRSIPFPVLPVRGWKGKLVHAATAVIHFGLRLLHISKPWLIRKCIEISTRYNALGDGRVSFLCDTTPTMELWEAGELFPLVELPFEGGTLPFGHDLDASLTRMYGDYMTPPPVEKQKNHFPYELDFGPWAEIPEEELYRYYLEGPQTRLH